MKDTHKDRAKVSLPPSIPPSPAVAVAVCSLPTAQTTTATTRRTRKNRAAPVKAKSPFTPEQWQELREAVTTLHGDRKLPFGWSLRNDLSICKAMAKRWSFADLLAMIEGLAVLRARGDVSWIHPREAVTLRALRKMSGVERVEHKALAAGYQARNTKPEPTAQGAKRAPLTVAAVMADLMQRVAP